VRELQAGLWHWQAPHPYWTPGEQWPQEVSSYAIDDGARLLLFDPLSVPDELLALAADREPVVVLTAPWHERDTQSLVERLGVPVFVPPPDTADDLVRKYGITFEQGRRRQPRRCVAAGRGWHRGLPREGAQRPPCCARARALLTADVHPVACASDAGMSTERRAYCS
jgi:hypothetical protein